MQVVNVVVVKNGVVDHVYSIIGNLHGNVTNGVYAGQSLSTGAESKFWEECRKIDPSLPETIPDEEDEFWTDENRDQPDLDGGFFEKGYTSVFLTWSTLI